MSFQNPQDEEIRTMLQNAKTIAVIGLSDKPDRTSYAIAHTMQQRGYRILPVNPTVDEVLGERAFKSVADITEQVDIINVFRRSEALPQVIQECLQTSAPVIWCQQGVYHEHAAKEALAAGKTVIMDLCIAVAHSRLLGRQSAGN